jgi:hypothetical protein
MRFGAAALALGAAAATSCAAQSAPIGTVGELVRHVRSCWRPPEGERGVIVTVRFSLRRDGTLLAEPRQTFITGGLPADVRERHLAAAFRAVHDCTPAPLAPELGEAVAGRPISLRFTD